MAVEWPITRLGDIARVKHGFAFDGTRVVEEETPDVLVTPGNFEIGGGFKHGKFKYYSGEAPSEYVLKTGDLVVTMTDLSKASDTLGYSALVPALPGYRFLHNQRIGKVEITNPAVVEKGFLHWLFRTSAYRNEILASSTGTSIKHTAPSRIEAFCFHIPTLPEQRAIDHILGTLDDKIELNRRMNETLEAMARALFKSWFVDFDPVRAKAEGRDLDLPQPLADLFPDSFEDSELGEIPSGWQVGPILDHARLLSGGTPKTDRPEYWDGPIAWASAKDVSQSIGSFLVETERTITERGLDESATQMVPAFCSVVVARGATTGRMVLFGHDMAMNQTCYALATTTETPFALYCRMREEIDALVHAAHGSIFDTITTSTFASSRIVLPPQAVLKAFEERVAPVFQRVLRSIHECRALAALRDTLLPRLISGELRVKDTVRLVEEAVA